MPYAETIMTSDANGTYRGVYTYGLDRIAERDLAAIEGVPNDPLYYLYDGRGSVTQLVNTENHVRDKYRYTPFGVPMPGGQLTPNTRLFNNPYGYNGEDYDIESGLQFLRARYYNPETARFISRDSYLGDVMKPLSLNRYAYTSNNPVMNIDPSGHMEEYSGEKENYTKEERDRQKEYLLGLSNSSASNKPVLKMGSSGSDVAEVQQILKHLGFNIGEAGVDGKYGEDTENAVDAFQVMYNLQVDGEVGPQTWGELRKQYGIYLDKQIGNSVAVDSSNVGCGDKKDISSGTNDTLEAESVSNIYTWEEADKYINSRVYGMSIGHKLYSANEASKLPKEIIYTKDGYTYAYALDEYYFSFMGVQMDTPNYSVKMYEYKLAYTDEPELNVGIIFIGGSGIKGNSTAAAFEKKISKMSPNDRVAAVKTEINRVVKEHGLIKDNKLTRINGRDVYRNPNTGELFSVDTQHGRFESLNPKNGKHLGEVDVDFKPIPNSIDKSGGHDIKMK